MLSGNFDTPPDSQTRPRASCLLPADGVRATSVVLMSDEVSGLDTNKAAPSQAPLY